MLVLSAFVYSNKQKEADIVSESNLIENKRVQYDNTSDITEINEKTPEQVLLEMEVRENPEINGPLSADIVSPVEESFQVSQARMYSAEITNGISSSFKKTECNWRFYLNENNEEVLYKEMSVPMTGDSRCSFTSTFIDRRGKLRVELDVVLLDSNSGETLDSYVTEKVYLVD